MRVLFLLTLALGIASAQALPATHRAVFTTFEVRTAGRCGGAPFPDTPYVLTSATTVTFEHTCGANRAKGTFSWSFPTTMNSGRRDPAVFNFFKFDDPFNVSASLAGEMQYPRTDFFQVGVRVPFSDTSEYTAADGGGNCPDGSFSSSAGFQGSATRSATMSCRMSPYQSNLRTTNGVLELRLNVYSSWIRIATSGETSPAPAIGFDVYAVYRLEELPKGDLVITHVVPVQVIHNVETLPCTSFECLETPIIAGRRTVVRVFVKSTGSAAAPFANVDAVLRGFPGSSAALQSFTLPITAKVYTGPLPPTGPPDFEEESIDFLLPDAWSKDLATYPIEAEIALPAGVQDTNTSNNKKTVPLVFAPPPRYPLDVLTVGYVTICVPGPDSTGGGTVTYCPSANVGGFTQFVNRLYPLAEGRFSFFELARVIAPYPRPINTTEEMHAALASLREAYQRYAPLSPLDQLIGFLGDAPGIPHGGLADARWVGGEGEVALVLDNSGRFAGFPAYNLAHEIGHNLGLRHVNQGPPDPQCKLASDACTRWPYTSPKIQTAGYDVPNLRLVSATNHYDLMSYCSDALGSTIWISPYSYRLLFDGNLVPSLSPPKPGTCSTPAFSVITSFPASRELEPARVAPTLSETPRDLLQVSGSVARDGSAAQLNPAMRLTTRRLPVASVASPYCLRFFSAAGALGDHCFVLDFTSSESSQLLDRKAFSLLVAPPAGITRIALMISGREVASIAGGSQPPALAINLPRAGDRWDGASPQDIVWTGSAVGTANALNYVVDYSSDGGANWIPLALRTMETRLTVNPAEITGGPSVFFRVIATDGLNNTTAQVGPINVVQTPKIAGPPNVNFRNGLVLQGVRQDVALTNSGTGPTDVTAVTFSDPAFTLISPRAPFKITAGETKPLTIQFAAPALGEKLGTMTVLSSASDNPSLAVALRGNGIARTSPDAAVTPTSVAFGTVPIGANKAQVLTVQSFGPAKLTVTGASLTGTGFSLTAATRPFTVEVSNTAIITITFAPQQAIAFTGSVTITTNDPAHATFTIPLTGQGAAAATFVNKNSASFAMGALAADMIAFGETTGTPIAPSLVVAPDGPWPTTLGGVTLDITDSQGATRAATLYYVAPTAMAYLMPAGTALGAGTARLTTSTGVIISSALTIDRIAPALYTANSTGSGVAAGLFLGFPASGAPSFGLLFNLPNRNPLPVDLGAPGDQVFLSLYGTGFRAATQATATVGGVTVPVQGLAATGIYQGEDVINLGPLPRSLAGHGVVDIVVNFDGKPANTVIASIK